MPSAWMAAETASDTYLLKILRASINGWLMSPLVLIEAVDACQVGGATYQQ